MTVSTLKPIAARKEIQMGTVSVENMNLIIHPIFVMVYTVLFLLSAAMMTGPAVDADTAFFYLISIFRVGNMR